VTSLLQTSCASALASDRSSDLIGQLSLSAYKNWTVNVGMQWDPGQGRSERGDLFLQYRPAGNRTVNLGYNYQRDSVNQWVSSFAWPISGAWSGYGRVVYSQLDKKFLDHFGGLEYRSCCWNIRAVVGRAVTTRSGEYDTQYKLQLELKGLSSVGTADAFLEGSIPGYSARQ
jgi:LPS-assembly protein